MHKESFGQRSRTADRRPEGHQFPNIRCRGVCSDHDSYQAGGDSSHGRPLLLNITKEVMALCEAPHRHFTSRKWGIRTQKLEPHNTKTTSTCKPGHVRHQSQEKALNRISTTPKTWASGNPTTSIAKMKRTTPDNKARKQRICDRRVGNEGNIKKKNTPFPLRPSQKAGYNYPQYRQI